MKIIIHTDGGARGNPGPAGIGVVISGEDGKTLEEHEKFIGHKTNNQAEYEAVLLAFKRAEALGAQDLRFYLDSELVVRQLRGEYKIKHENISQLARSALAAVNKFSSVTFTHIPRAKNKRADELVNQAIDQAAKS